MKLLYCYWVQENVGNNFRNSNGDLLSSTQCCDKCTALTLAVSFQKTAAVTSSISKENLTESHTSSLTGGTVASAAWPASSPSKIVHVIINETQKEGRKTFVWCEKNLKRGGGFCLAA